MTTQMTDTAPTPTDTVKCPRPHSRGPGYTCWLCGEVQPGAGQLHGSGPCGVDAALAAAYRMGGMYAVSKLLLAYPEDYAEAQARYSAYPQRPAK